MGGGGRESMLAGCGRRDLLQAWFEAARGTRRRPLRRISAAAGVGRPLGPAAARHEATPRPASAPRERLA